jgi:GNAT superfamily N-acetyltransferase
MPNGSEFRVGILKRSEIAEADRIMRLAFGTFLGVPDPMQFMAGREFVRSRARAKNTRVFAARHGERLVGSCIATRWGAFGFFGPLTVLPEYWDRGVARRLLKATTAQFARWGLRQTGLFTFAGSPKHVGLYQSFGYWPRSLTAIMTRAAGPKPEREPDRLSRLDRKDREAIIAAAAKLTFTIGEGLDLTEEIRSTLAHGTGDVVLDRRRGLLNGFAICLTGAGSEGGAKTCYVKFGAARGGKAAAQGFGRLLDGCEAYAATQEATIEAGTNLARERAFRVMQDRRYRVTTLGVAMLRPNREGFNRPDCWVIDDWR